MIDFSGSNRTLGPDGNESNQVEPDSRKRPPLLQEKPYSKVNGEAVFPDNGATAIWGSKAPFPVEDWGDSPKGMKKRMHRGHLLGRQLGGGGEDRRNLAPLYSRVNTPEMRNRENKIAEHIQEKETILYSVIPHYDNGGNLPTKLILNAVDNRGYTLNYPLINKP